MTNEGQQSRRCKRADRILSKIDGTLLADIRSMRHWATLKTELGPGMGHLNFALMAISLIGCERLGILTSAVARNSKPECDRRTDPGGYIVEFICGYFPQKHPFKRIAKILADAMRHELVHGFGGRKSSAPFELGLYVSGEAGRLYEIRNGSRRPTLAINSVAVADTVLTAVEQPQTSVAPRSRIRRHESR